MSRALPLLLGGGLFGLLLLTVGGPPPAKPALPAPEPLPYLPPVGPVARSSAFGWRTDPVKGGREFHAGIDLPVRTGTAVRAPQAGRVARIDRADDGQHDANGNAVFLAIGEYRWCFLHLSTVLVRPGQIVQRGEVIAFSGNTGKSTGPHLHLQVYDPKGQPVDPESFFPPGTFRNRQVA